MSSYSKLDVRIDFDLGDVDLRLVLIYKINLFGIINHLVSFNPYHLLLLAPLLSFLLVSLALLAELESLSRGWLPGGELGLEFVDVVSVAHSEIVVDFHSFLLILCFFELRFPLFANVIQVFLLEGVHTLAVVRSLVAVDVRLAVEAAAVFVIVLAALFFECNF